MNAICDDCDVLLNHQANKFNGAAALSTPEAIQAHSAALEEAQACPRCGKSVLPKRLEEVNKPRHGIIRRVPFAYHGIL